MRILLVICLHSAVQLSEFSLDKYNNSVTILISHQISQSTESNRNFCQNTTACNGSIKKT